MNWTTASAIRGRLERLWEQGALARAILVRDQAPWSLRIPIRGPNADELLDGFAEVRDWIASLEALPQLKLEWRETRHRVLGRQRLPTAASFEHPEQALALIGKTREARRLQHVHAQTSARAPALLDWIIRKPLQALELSVQWPRLLDVVDWLRANPRPGIFIRTIDLPGIDSKFIESHRGLLSELLDLSLPATAIDTQARGVSGFARRYGFLDKPERIRFRILDPDIGTLPGLSGQLPDITIDAAGFAAFAGPIERVYITENEINFLAFPRRSRSIVVFGAGYGWSVLQSLQWLERCAVVYWGDIDTHGFAILDGLRAHLPHAQSMLMDRQTLFDHRDQWGEEPSPTRNPLSRLTADEAAVYDDLRFDRIRPGLRLEQERIAWSTVQATLATEVAGSIARSPLR